MIANLEAVGEKKKLELLTSTKISNPYLGLDCMKHLRIKLNTKTFKVKVFKNFEYCKFEKNGKIFHENRVLKGREINMQLKPDRELLQLKGPSIPIQIQPVVGKVIEKLKNCRIEEATDNDETCFVIPGEITVKTVKTIQLPCEITVKRTAQMPNTEALVSRLSRKIPDGAFSKFYSLGLRIQSKSVVKERNRSVHVSNYRRQLHRVI